MGSPAYASYTQRGLCRSFSFCRHSPTGSAAPPCKETSRTNTPRQLASAPSPRQRGPTRYFVPYLPNLPSASSPNPVYPLREHEAKAGTLNSEKIFLERPAVRVRRAETWQSSSSSWPMNVGGCRSRCRPRPPPMNCATASPMPATTSSLSAPAAASAASRKRKVKLEPFLIFNQQFLTLIRAGLPILGSLKMLAKIQKNAQFAAQLEDVSNRVKTGEAALRRLRSPERLPRHVHHHPAGRRTLRQPAGGARSATSTSRRSRSPSAKS